MPAIVCDANLLSQVAIIQELGRLKVPVTAIASAGTALGFASRYASKRIVAPVPSHSDAYAGYLIDSVEPGVIFCSNDANTELLSRRRDSLVAAGFRILVAKPEVLAGLIDKGALYRTGLECGVRVPECIPIEGLDELHAAGKRIGVPSILKSTNLAGGVYRAIGKEGEYDAALLEMRAVLGSSHYRHRNAGLILQKWIDPAGVRLWNFNACVQGGEIVSYAICERVRSDVSRQGTPGSALLYGRSAHNAAILNVSRRLLRHTGYEGILECEWSQSVTDPDDIYLYDFNPRPSGNIRWVMRSGAAVVEQYYRICLDLPVDRPGPSREGVRYIKFFYKDNDLLEALASRRSLRAKLAIAFQDLACLVGFWKNAIDVFDPTDLRPTVRASMELLNGLWSRASHRFSPRLAGAATRNL
jgi:predicted ATP-grasp superfamily ATP-dependent carboligase